MANLPITLNSLPPNNGSPITDIEYRVDGGSAVSSGGTDSFVIEGLAGGVEVDVEIRAVNAVGPAAWSAAKTATPPADPDPDPEPADPAVWTTTTGVNKSTYITVSGDPALVARGAAGVGASQLVRSDNPAHPEKFQFEAAISTLNNYAYIGVDNGATDLSGFASPGNSDLHGVVLAIQDNYWQIYHGGIAQDHTAATYIENGDILTVTGDKATGEVKFYRTRSGSTIQIGATVTVASPYTDWYAIGGSNHDTTLTAKFGAGQARTLDSGFGTYGG